MPANKADTESEQVRSTTSAAIPALHARARADALLFAGHRGAVRLAGFGPKDRTAHGIDANGDFRSWDASNGRGLAHVPSSAPLGLGLRDARASHALVVDMLGGVTTLDLAGGAPTWMHAWDAPVLGVDLAAGGSLATIVDAHAAWLLRADGTRSALVEGEVHGAWVDATNAVDATFTP